MDLSRFKDTASAVPWIAVFVYRNAPPHSNLHTGILYRDAKKRLHCLHLGWHRKLYNELCDDIISCAIPLLDPVDFADELFLAGFCEKIGRSTKNEDIPYNLKIDPDVHFDRATGEIRFGTEFTGLSCATFVIAVFRSSGNPLVDTLGWPLPDAEDIRVQEAFLDLLAKSKDPEHRLQAVRVSVEVGTPRARPEHVAGACLENELPVQRPTCDVNGMAIVELLDRWQNQMPS